MSESVESVRPDWGPGYEEAIKERHLKPEESTPTPGWVHDYGVQEQVLEVDVTADDIFYGVKSNVNACAIYRALDRSGQGSGWSVNGNEVTGPGGWRGRLPQVARRFIQAFDGATQTALPFSFRLKLRRG